MKNTYMVKKRGTFKYTFINGKVYNGKYINIYVTELNRNNNAFGVCVSKKNGISVKRNKFKRWVREVYKKEEIKLKKGLTTIISFKKIKFNDINFELIKEDIMKGFDYLNVYKDN